MTPSTRSRAGLAAVWGAALACALPGAVARADDAAGPDKPVATADAAKAAIDRTWLYADDARVAAPLAVVATTSVSYTHVGGSPSRVVSPADAPAGCKAPCNAYNAFAASTATPGAMAQVGGEVGLARRVSLLALAQMGLGASQLATGGRVGGLAGLRVDLLAGGPGPVHLVLSGGYLREAWQGPSYDDATDTWRPGATGGADGAWARLSLAGDLGALRLAATGHVEHVFASFRDGLDVMLQAGASYHVVGPLRAGVEYVGQDLEETFAPVAEGGARHLVGPTASLQLLGDRLTIVSGPSLGLTRLSPDFVYRLQASYGF